MIIWVFFQPGAGGDGFANFLEQAENVTTIDERKQWRVHRYVDYKPKFWAPELQNSTTRTNTTEQLTDQQIEIACSDDRYLVITSHDISIKHTFNNDKIPAEKNIKIFLRCNDFRKQLINFMVKNLQEFDDKKNISYKELNFLPDVDFIINMDQIIDSWEYTNQLINSIGLPLTKEIYTQYKEIVSGELLYHTPGIEYYESFVDNDGITRYKRIK